MDYVVTLSTPNAGASVFGLHFQAMPRILEFRDQKYDLFGWLDFFAPTSIDNSLTRLERYPAVCLRARGDEMYVAQIIWHLAEHYNALVSYNLVIRPCTPRVVAAYFFPRPFLPIWEGPRAYIDERWAFGAFEMGGLFLIDCNRQSAFQAVLHGGPNAYEALAGYLRELTIPAAGAEAEQMTKLVESAGASADPSPGTGRADIS
jgi:hypothetical protein